jgi:aspartate aminotransferase
MADRIIGMRSTLFDLLKEVGSKKDWKHIKSQIGMFAYLVSLRNLTFSLSLH